LTFHRQSGIEFIPAEQRPFGPAGPPKISSRPDLPQRGNLEFQAARPDLQGEGVDPSPAETARILDQVARSVDRVCPRWLAASRDDIVQASLLRVLEIRRRSEQNDGPPASYLWKVAYTATVDEIRRLRRRREDPLPAEDPPGNDDPFAAQSSREIGEAVRGCLGRMIERRRVVVGLSLMGHSLAEMGRLMRWEGKKVRNLLYRGLADLRRCLESKGVKP
jgi:RNA polymerase sigma-70 factor (ECF subfamily)